MAKRFKGKVISDSVNKTIVVEITRVGPHPLYRKVLKKRKKLYAHDEKQVKKGDQVIIRETRPLSKLKRFEVIEVIKVVANKEVKK
ncbi:MAG: 30S ribosomal protein S17 [Candidatus Shapirobacteria bacterium]